MAAQPQPSEYREFARRNLLLAPWIFALSTALFFGSLLFAKPTPTDFELALLAGALASAFTLLQIKTGWWFGVLIIFSGIICHQFTMKSPSHSILQSIQFLTLMFATWFALLLPFRKTILLTKPALK
jgi:hypothetical protein